MKDAMPVPRPKAVRTAVLLLAFTTVLGGIRLVLEKSTLPQAPTPDYQNAANLLAAAVFLFLGLVVYLIWRGHNWARILFTVLFLLGLPASVKPLLHSFQSEPLSGLLGLAQVLIQIAALVLLYHPQARGWFRQGRGAPKV